MKVMRFLVVVIGHISDLISILVPWSLQLQRLDISQPRGKIGSAPNMYATAEEDSHVGSCH